MKVLITGASGKLGGYLLEEARSRAWNVEAWSHSSRGLQSGYPLVPVDLASTTSLERALEACAPQLIIHSAAISAVSDCYKDPQRALLVNQQAPRFISQWAQARGARLLFVSTDMIFDGEGAPYGEEALPTPVTAYGRSKTLGEQAVADNPQALIVRVALLVGRSKTHHLSFFEHLIDKLKAGQPSTLFEDEWRTPLYLGDAAYALCQLAQSQAVGVVHAGGPHRMSRLEMGLEMARALQLPTDLLKPISRLQGDFAETRQRDLSLTSHRIGGLLPDFRPRPLAEAFL